MKSFDDYKKLAAKVSEQSKSGKVDPGLKAEKIAAFNAYRQEVRKEAREGRYVAAGKPVMTKDADGQAVQKKGPSRKSLHEAYVRKLSDQPLPKSADNPRGLSPAALAAQRLGVG
jgi:hypothetical protein